MLEFVSSTRKRDEASGEGAGCIKGVLCRQLQNLLAIDWAHVHACGAQQLFNQGHGERERIDPGEKSAFSSSHLRLGCIIFGLPNG